MQMMAVSYAFSCNVNTETNKSHWNYYASGDAPNWYRGNALFGGANPTNAKVTIDSTAGKITCVSTASADAATTVVTKDYVDTAINIATNTVNGYKNMAMNGDMRIHQRATTDFVGRYVYSADRWAAYQNNTETKREQITNLPGFAFYGRKKYCRNNSLKGISHPIELDDPTNSPNPTQAPIVQGQQYTLSWWAVQRDGTALSTLTSLEM